MKNSYRVTHKGHFKNAFDQAKEALGLAMQWYEAAEKQFEYLAETQASAKKVLGYLAELFPFPARTEPPNDSYDQRRRYDAAVKRIEETRNSVIRKFEGGLGADLGGIRGTAWMLYNAVTEWADHEYRGGDEQRLNSIWFGDRSKLKSRAYDLALDLPKLS